MKNLLAYFSLAVLLFISLQSHVADIQMTAILGKQIKFELKNSGVKYVTIGGLANEWISYILDKEQYFHGEGYESSVSFFGPDLGKLIVDKVIQTTVPLVVK